MLGLLFACCPGVCRVCYLRARALSLTVTPLASIRSMNKKERRMMITEVNILRDIDHAHVVDFLKSALCSGPGANACGGADL